MNTGEKTLGWLRHEQLRVDDKWSIDLPNGFMWWAAEHRQTIRIASSEEGPDGDTAYFIGVETEVFEDVQMTDETLEILNVMMMGSSMAGIVYKPEERRINLCSMVRVHEVVREWMSPLISIAAMLQILEAQRFSENLTEEFGWSVAKSGHPESGLRTTPDELVFGVRELIEQTGGTPSQWKEAEFERAHAQYMQAPPSVLATTGGAGITAEFPYAGHTSLCQLVGNQPHPAYGSGLLLLQKFPVTDLSEADGVRKALELNRDQLTGKPSGYGFGSYCYNNGCICFTGFLPNCAYRPGLLPNLYYTAAERAYFAEREISTGCSDHV